MSWRRPCRRRVLTGLGLAIAATALLSWRLTAGPLPARLAIGPSPVVAWSDGTPAHVFLAPDDRYRMAVDVDDVDPDYVGALLRFEDKRFSSHPGIDPLAILRSIAINVRSGRTLTGASTITMQLVRLLEPRPRTLRSKMIEAWRALQIEQQLSKRQILSLYLTFTPYGGNLEGIEAASWAYFGHSARRLSTDEIAVLLAVPQRPAARSPSPRNRERLRRARDEIGHWLLARGVRLDSDGPLRPAAAVETELRAAAVPVGLRPMPRAAPYAAFWLRQRHVGPRLRTTLDRGVQRTALAILEDGATARARLGIHNGAVVVIEHREAAVRALVGGPDFWSSAPGAQIPGFDIARSAGSTLKPFIYATAMDRGLVLPERLVPDVPRTWGDYAPENYDRRYRGVVRLEEALAESLNLPFAELLGRVGVERFVGTLRHAGLSRIRPEAGYYGLSAAVGAVELTPLEMAGLYATLASGGRYRPPRVLTAEARSTGLPILTPGAAWLTRRALSRRDRPDFPRRRSVAGVPFPIHWKTGTSAGHRDAWAVGSGPRFTVAVWLGNVDRTPAADLVGAAAAGPLLFRVLEALEESRPLDAALPPTRDLGRVEVCRLSGYRPTRACPNRRHVLALEAHVPTDRCPFHVELEVEDGTGLALAPGCRAGRPHSRRTFVAWPGDALRFLPAAFRGLPTPPSLAPGCIRPHRGRAPVIEWPPAGQIVILSPGLSPGQQEVPLEVDAASTALRVSWFVDGHLLGTAPPTEQLWWRPATGRHELLVVDDAGRSASRSVIVR